jgi:hypothetical protein
LKKSIKDQPNVQKFRTEKPHKSPVRLLGDGT